MQLSTSGSVLSVGRLYCDLVFSGLPQFPSLGTEVFSEGFSVHAGGGAFITAAHLSQLGHPTSLAAMLPSSPFTDLMQKELVQSGVDLTLCSPLPQAAAPQVTVAMPHAGDRAFLTHKSGRAFPDLDAKEIAARAFRHVHIGEVASLLAQPAIIDIARTLGMTISVDCGWEDVFDVAALRPLLGEVDVFLPNEMEMDALRKLGLLDPVAPMTVVKKGAQGATLISEGRFLDAEAETVEVVDATGAGDAFNAGFLSSWLSGANPRQCLEAGNRRGALCVRTRGGVSTSPAPVQDAGLVVK